MIGRPEAGESAPYYHKYIGQVGDDDPKRAIESQLGQAVAFFNSIPDAKSLHRYAPDKWSIREVLNHINDTERVFSYRAMWFARGFASPLPSFDQNIAVGAGKADSVPWAEHIEEFRRVRLSTISLFRSMPADAWDRAGIASDNRVTVRALAFIIAGHVSHHVAILRERYF